MVQTKNTRFTFHNPFKTNTNNTRFAHFLKINTPNTQILTILFPITINNPNSVNS